ncbi:MAG: type IX secretion system membrane protein PorP/SprF [Flavobacteriaceae bacterium]|jgi:type IX secretion system PorP/SprF family membrane protein|nr:type IX secretion system membrane protein PorP/SprF [Flavobacteriaceae bacterium]
MKLKSIYILTVIFVSNIGFAQDNAIKNQNKIMGAQNPSFYAFGDSSKAGVLTGSEGFSDASKIETKFAFINHFFRDNDFSLALDVKTVDVTSLGYSVSSANLHYIYRTQLNYKWTFNPSVSIGYGNNSLNYNNLVFEDQINVLTGSIAGVTVDPVNIDGKINYFDLAAGFTVRNNENLFFGLNAKHLNTPDTSFNSTANNKKALMISLQAGYEYDLNPYGQGILPAFSYLYLYNSFTMQAAKSRIDLYQEVILGNISLGLNQHINNYEGITISQFGTSLSVFVEQIEFGINYSIDMVPSGPAGTDFNSFELYITFDFNPDNKNKRGNNSRFYGL